MKTKMPRLLDDPRLAWLVLAGVLALFSIPDSRAADDAAQAVPAGVAASVIEGRALHGAQGAIAVNQAAGDHNLQANAAALAVSEGGVAAAQVLNAQATDPRQANAPRVAVSVIGQQAFGGVHGLVSINQASGVGNAQANGVAIAVGNGVVIAESLSESMLAESAAGAPAARHGAPGARVAVIADSAFEGARGLVQVNQTAGSGNATANNFALSLSLDAKPQP